MRLKERARLQVCGVLDFRGKFHEPLQRIATRLLVCFQVCLLRLVGLGIFRFRKKAVELLGNCLAEVEFASLCEVDGGDFDLPFFRLGVAMLVHEVEPTARIDHEPALDIVTVAAHAGHREVFPAAFHQPERAALAFGKRVIRYFQRDEIVNEISRVEPARLHLYYELTVGKARWSFINTEISGKVFEALDYSLSQRCLVLIEGLERRGKTFAAKAWCQQHPGEARFVTVPSTSDDIGFFHAIARGLGLSSGGTTKAVQLRDKIHETIYRSKLMLVFDSAHFLFPQTNYREAIPQRITWLLTSLVDEGVPVALISTPQFSLTQQITAERSKWRDAQLTGRIMHFEKLPDELSEADLRAVARSFLPDADERTITMAVRYAEASDKYLQGIDALTKRGIYLANRAGRETPSHGDLKEAMETGVIPSDRAMVTAIEGAREHLHGKSRRKRRTQSEATVRQQPAEPPPSPPEPFVLAPREIRPAGLDQLAGT